MDLVPGRDLSSVSGLDPTQGQAKRISNERQMIAKLDPEVLQDRYLRLYDDHWVLKQHARKQEDKLTKLATTLKKVIADKKKSEALPLGVKAATRDVETENRLTDQQNQISKLQEENKLLRQRLVVSQQQAQQMRKSATMYDDVSSKIDTGQPKRLPATLMNNIRVIGPRDSSRSGATPRANSGLLEEARMTNRQLEESLEKANQQLSVNEQELERLRQQLRQRDAEFDQNLQRLKAQSLGGDSRTNLQENIDMIRLQRDLRDKSDELRRLQTQSATFESQNRSLQHTNAELLKEVDRLDREIKAEQQRSMQLRGELRSGSRSNTAVPELKAEIDDLRRECQLLKDANTKIVSSAFNADREREFREKERALQLKIAQLEATMKADMNERGSLLDRITTERNTKRDSEEEHRQMHLKYLETREKYDDLAEKMRFFEREGDINMKEIEEALIILRQRKQREEPNFDFLQKVDDEKAQNLNRRILDLESQLVEAQNELEKVRNLLITQHKINREYKAEMECMQRKMDEVKGESDQRLVETSYHLDIRRERILKLEKALKDVAYGTRSYRIQEPAVGEGDLVEQAIELERGQNLIEIHISRATFAERALEFFGKGNEPSTFCSIEFFEHELQMSPIIKGRTPEYNFTAQYIVNVDDFLLYYLQKEYTLIELHQTVGQAFQTVAACKLSLKQLVEGTHGRIHGTAKLIASHESNLDIGTFGTIEFWVRLRVPMEQAFRLLKEKMKAQGYLATTSRSARAAEETEKQRELDPNMNELTVAILNCSNVKSMVPGQQPDLFCVYKFYDFPDHDSITIPASNNPNFDDRAQYPVQMDADLDRYLKQQQMTIFVFDNQDPQTDRYVARADIPLISLAHDSPIKGTFDLYNDRGERNGTMDVTMKWNNSYLPPSSSTRTASQRARAGPTNIREPVALLPDESVSGYKTLAQKKKELDVHVRQKDVITSDTESRRTPDKLRKTPNGGEPTPSRVTRPPTTTNGQPAHPRTSSNASVASKRVSFDHRDDSDSVVYPTENPPFAHDETIRTVSPDSNIGEEQPPPRPTPYVDDSEPDIVYDGAHKNNGDIVTIGVHELTLNERCSVFDDDDREKVFVSVEFLDFPLEQMETPYALPKGTPNTKYSFNFQQDYSVANPERKRQLAELLSSRSGEIRFTVVAEPAEDQQDALDCLDVGYATVDVKELLRKGSDISEKDIPVHGLDADGEVIGKMNVTVSIVSALNKAQQDQTRRLRT